MGEDPSPPLIGTVLFDGFELLDTYGPLELLLMNRGLFGSVMLAEEVGEVRSSQGPKGVADQALAACRKVDVLLVPGGFGTRKAVADKTLLGEISRLAETASYVCSVCTGAALLAKAGVLDGHRATTNKAAWAWATSQGGRVDWIATARWVEDGRFFTSSGVSAGMDMALGLIERIHGTAQSLEIAKLAEYEWHQDRNADPFAKIYGLG